MGRGAHELPHCCRRVDALLPGAYLITPVATATLPPAQPAVQPDGSIVSAGYMYNAFDPSHPLDSVFQVSSESVVRSRADYGDASANTFFAQNAAAAGTVVPLLPEDGGQLVFDATQQLNLLGSIRAAAGTGGRGGFVDITSTQNIVINATGMAPNSGGSDPGTLYLSSTELTGANSGSLLIGGTETAGTEGTVVTVTAPSLTVDNFGAPLEGSDIILVANQSLTVAANAQIEALNTVSNPAQTLQISDPIQLQPAASLASANPASTLSMTRDGTLVVLPLGIPNGDKLVSSVAGSYLAPGRVATSFAAGTALSSLAAGTTVTLAAPGTLTATGTGNAISIASSDGALLRVSSSTSAATTRSNVVSSVVPSLQVGAGATISGASVTVDSTNGTSIDPSASIAGAISLSGGGISLLLDNTVPSSAVSAGLVLTPAMLSGFQSNATSLSLLSYSSIDTYGAGTVGSPTFTNLALHTAEIRGFQATPDGLGIEAGSSGDVQFVAKNIVLDDSPNGSGPGAIPFSTPAGNLDFQAGAIVLGANSLAIDQFANVTLSASGGVRFQGSGGIAAASNLTVTAPLVAGAAGAVQTIAAGGDLAINPSGGGAPAVSPGGIGASLNLVGSNVAVGTDILLPSGRVAVQATGASAAGGDVTLSGTLDVSGTAKTFNEATSYTNGGQVELVSANGNVVGGARRLYQCGRAHRGRGRRHVVCQRRRRHILRCLRRSPRGGRGGESGPDLGREGEPCGHRPGGRFLLGRSQPE